MTTYYKWFERGARDLETGHRWPSGGRWVRMRSWRRPASYAIAVEGLAYEIDEELWEVELDGVLGPEPFPEQAQHVPAPGMLRETEQRVRARRGRLVRRIEAWSPAVTAAFTFEVASRVRGRCLQAVRDAASTLTECTDGWNADGQAGVTLAHESAIVRHTERLLRVWRQALTASASAGGLTAVDAGRAAALTREIAALTYASANMAGDGPDPGTAAAAAYLSSRRWQSVWLADRLGLEHGEVEQAEADRGGLDTGTRPAVPIDVFRDLARLESGPRKRILEALNQAHERAERAGG